MSSSSSGLDALFGPQLPGHFDFTLLFEHAMLMLVPTGVVVLVTPFQIKKVARTQRQVSPGLLLWAKLAAGLALVAIQASNIALWHDTDYFRSSVTVAASIMSLVASLCTMAIIFTTHAYSLQPSAFLSVFFSLTMLFDIAMARSYFLRDTLGAIAALQICVVVLKLLLVIFEEVPKRSLYLSQHLRSTVSAEAASGFWSRSLFLWLNPLLLFGWRNTFTLDELPDIGDEFASEKLFDLFLPHWTKVRKRARLALLTALLRTLAWQFGQVFLPRLCLVGLTIAQPFLLLRTVEEVSQGVTDRNTSNALIGAAALIYFGLAVTRALFEHWEYRLVTSIRGILVVAIYDKMQRLSVEDLESFGAVTLMSTDVQGTEQIIGLAYECFFCLLQVAFGMWILFKFIGPACFLILIPTSATFLMSIVTGKSINKARIVWNEAIEKRVTATSNLLAQLRTVKAMGLSASLSAHIEQKREAEIEVALRERYRLLWIIAFGAMNFTVTPAVVFAGAYFWTRAEDPMSIAEIFAILAVLAISSNPLMSLFRSMTAWSQGFASILRIQTFLALEDLDDPRGEFPPVEQATATNEASSLARKNPFAVELNDVSVTSPTTGPIFRQVTLGIPWGALAIFWGPISCGKSTILKLLLGEAQLNSGTVSVGSKKISYCSQESWIPNETFQQAIVGGLEFIESRYRAVLRACALDVDLMEMPDGDQTKTGSGGCNLSGGQRQRLSLARAAYAQNETMVVDDIFSSVDPETAGLIFQRLFGPSGMVRSWNCTVIMTTNRLELLGFADLVYRFTADGRVQHCNNLDGALPLVENTNDVSSNDRIDCNPIRNDASNNSNRGNEIPSVLAKEDMRITQSEAGGTSGDISLYAYFLRSAGLPVLVGWVLLAVTAALGEWMPVIFLRIWFSKFPGDDSYFIGYSVFSVASVFLNVAFSAYYFAFILPKITNEMHRRLLKAVLRATPQYINDTDSGSLLNRFSQDVSLITQRLAIFVNQFVFLTFTVLVEIGMISAGSIYVVPVMGFIILILCVIQLFYLRSSRQLRQLELEASSALFTQFTETCDGIQHIRSFGWQEKFRRQLYAKLDRSQKPEYLLYCIQRWLTLSMDGTSAVATIFLVSLSLSLPGTTSDSAVGLAMLSLIGFSSTTSGYIQTWTAFETSLGAVRRIKQFEENTPQEQDTVSGPPLPEDWPTNGRIEVDSVTATYRTEEGAVHRALDNTTVTIQEGQKVGLMGRTGSGKTTMLSTLLRMVDYTGSISIDGRDTRTVPRELLRSRITTMTQNGLQLTATLRFNLYPYEGPLPSDEEMIDVLRRVNLWDHANAHGGLNSDYAKIRFSVAQKQLMFLARAILHQATLKTKILMVDEATSTMTVDMEEHMQRLIDESFAGCTILMISHRTESFKSADVVLQFDTGRLHTVLRRGSNGELVAS